GNVIIDGIKIHYYRSGGKKPPIVLLHGATDDGLCWGRTANCIFLLLQSKGARPLSAFKRSTGYRGL
ncbi:MAG: alpha/beta hydrolase, partial [Acidobacteriota bacterium]